MPVVATNDDVIDAIAHLNINGDNGMKGMLEKVLTIIIPVLMMTGAIVGVYTDLNSKVIKMEQQIIMVQAEHDSYDKASKSDDKKTEAIFAQLNLIKDDLSAVIVIQSNTVKSLNRRIKVLESEQGK